MARLAAVVPVLNEAQAIVDVVHGLRSSGACCVFVVDGGSIDGTPARAKAAGAFVVTEPRPGYGRACLTGAAAAAHGSHPHELVAFLDGDGSCDPAELGLLRAQAETSDVVLGVRHPAGVERGAYPLHAWAGNNLTAILIARRTGRRVRDMSPFKVVRADVLARLQLRQEGFAWTTEFVARSCADKSLDIAEVPISFRARRGGRSKVSGRLGPSARAGLHMLRAAIAETAPRPRLVVMAKGPQRAKSRLAAQAGPGVAAGFWTASIADTAAHMLEAARAEGLEARLMLSDADELSEMRDLLGPSWLADVQQRPGLHEALVEVFDAAAMTGAPFAIAVSGDNPALPAALIHDAVRAQRRFDAVLGPTPDGGYWLVGFGRRFLARRNRIQLLHSIFDRHVSGGTAREAALRAMADAGLSVGIVESWPDVDDLSDLHELAATLAARPELAPATSAWLLRDVRWVIPGGAAAMDRGFQVFGVEEGGSDVRR